MGLVVVSACVVEVVSGSVEVVVVAACVVEVDSGACVVEVVSGSVELVVVSACVVEVLVAVNAESQFRIHDSSKDLNDTKKN